MTELPRKTIFPLVSINKSKLSFESFIGSFKLQLPFEKLKD